MERQEVGQAVGAGAELDSDNVEQWQHAPSLCLHRIEQSDV